MIPTPTPVASAHKIEELIAASFASRYDDLVATLADASQAVALIEETPDQLPADLVVRGWSQYGNALRLVGRYDEAETALAKAGALAISVPPATTVQLLSVKASLHRNRGRFESAANCLAEALEAQRPLGDPAGEARLLNVLGIIYLDWGKHSEALCSFLNALELLGPDSPPDLLLSTGHNLFETLIATDQLEEASAAMVLLEPFYRRLSSTRLTAKAEWLRARLCRALHHLDPARLAYERCYELLSAAPRTPELAQLTAEMADLGGCE